MHAGFRTGGLDAFPGIRSQGDFLGATSCAGEEWEEGKVVFEADSEEPVDRGGIVGIRGQAGQGRRGTGIAWTASQKEHLLRKHLLVLLGDNGIKSRHG